jgi:hypothetical protein
MATFSYEAHLLDEFLEDYGSSGEYIRDELMKEVKTMPPNEDSGVHALVDDPRYVALQLDNVDRRLSHDVKQLDGRITKHREELTANHKSMGERLGKATDANKDAINEMRIWQARADERLADYMAWKAMMMKVIIALAMATLGGGAAIGKFLLP